jgi:ABC-type histidine transport system ATPase subunit
LFYVLDSSISDGLLDVESKSFEIWSDVSGGVQMVERSRGVSRLIMAWSIVFWLFNAWDFLITGETVHENWRMFRFGSFAYVMQRRNNSFF